VGLGFDTKMLGRKTKDMSGGWRMRVSLGQALFAAPTLLLLDEPTNHLDLEACVWLEEHLRTYPKCLLVVSHSQDFLNSVCNKIIWLNGKTLTSYTGNYATFCKLVDNEEKIQAKLYEKQQADIAKLTEFVAVNKANKKTSKSAASKEKVLDKITSEAVDRPNVRQTTLSFAFPECTKLPPPVIPFSGVSFSYSGKKEDNLFEGLEFGIDCDTRIALVRRRKVVMIVTLLLMAVMGVIWVAMNAVVIRLLLLLIFGTMVVMTITIVMM
jgi:ATP-binding cassette subfamily F protein 2